MCGDDDGISIVFSFCCCCCLVSQRIFVGWQSGELSKIDFVINFIGSLAMLRGGPLKINGKKVKTHSNGKD